MSKNIILCADGTGNKGGYTPDSNIYKLYNAIDLHHRDIKQLVFYDNGVGTQTNKYIRAIAGAFGFGFKQNVCDLYEYLARNYDPDDKIYMFGFSRGAATIRACNGFIDACGLIDGRGKSNNQLKEEVKQAMEAYSKKGDERSQIITTLDIHQDKPEIEVIGVWDTVSALGFPERTNISGVFMLLLTIAFKFLGELADKWFPHKFYNYELTANVRFGYQALAIDDERTSFWPMIWQENTPEVKNVHIEQVWFVGMHSNVGGGYERAGLANVSFAWMLEKLHGLKFKSDVVISARENANVHGRMYDSRQGFAIYYRYHPRDIQSLCDNAGAKVIVHESVIRRLRRKTANYAPTSLPKKFHIQDNQGNIVTTPDLPSADWSYLHSEVNHWIWIRKWLYGIWLELTVLAMGLAGYLWIWGDEIHRESRAGLTKDIAEIFEYFTPKFFDGFIDFFIVQRPWLTTLGLLVILVYFRYRRFVFRKTVEIAEKLRKLLLTALNSVNTKISSSGTHGSATEVDKEASSI